MEHLDAVVAGVGHGNDPAGAEGDIIGIPKLSGLGPAHRSNLAGERAVGMEHLDAVVVGVGHGHDSAGAEVDAVGKAKLAVEDTGLAEAPPPLRPDLVGERAVGVEHLDARIVIAPQLAHGHDPAGAEVDAGGIEKLAGAPPLRSKPMGKRAVGVEHADAVVVPRHGQYPAGAEGDYAGERIPACFDMVRERAVGVEHLDAAAVIVGHGHDAAGAEVDVGSERKLVGARSVRSDMICERAVGVEHLDAVHAGVCHGQDPAGAEGDADGLVELAGAILLIMKASVAGGVVVVVVVVILRSQLIGKRAVGVEH